jgi:outer membrane protein assembly factor BamB
MMMTARRIRLAAGLLLLAATSSASADDWPVFRGPSRNGISAEKAQPWSTITWTAEVGTGFSSMAVAKGRVVTLGNANDTDTIYCLDAEKGSVLWKHAYPSALGDNYFEGGTTHTPTIDGDRVYTLGRWGDAFCFDLATGKILWSVKLQKDAGFPTPAWGFGGSPVVHGNLLLLNVGDAGLALEKGSGKLVWKSEAKECAYSTPYLVGQGDDTLMILGSAKSYVAVNAKTGAEAWRVKWLTQYGVNAADPIVDGDRMLLSTGYSKGAALFKLGKGEPELVWQSRVLRSQMNPPVLIGGYLYGVDGDTTEKTVLKCVEFATGTAKWSEPISGSGSVTAAGGDLVVLSGTGELLIAPASPEGFKPAHRAKVGAGKWWTVPVVANGRLYCRNADGQVVCLDAPKR